MTVFCMLWLPVFYLFRRSAESEPGSGSIWALLLGSIVALVQFFLGNIIEPGGFGFSRWMTAFVDIVAVPAILPLVIYLLFAVFRFSSGAVNFTNFALLWLIPGAGIRAVSWSSGSDPVLLILAPLLWTSLAAGIPFFINCLMVYSRWYIRVPSVLGILGLPFLASTAWWAFYSQKMSLGILFFSLSIIPLIISTIFIFRRPNA